MTLFRFIEGALGLIGAITLSAWISNLVRFPSEWVLVIGFFLLLGLHSLLWRPKKPTPP